MAQKIAKIRFRQGNVAYLPATSSGSSGEPLFCLDTGQFFISDGADNIEITPNITNISSGGGALYSELISVSGSLQYQIDNLDLDYVTDEELATVSGIIVAQIPTDYYTTGEVDDLISTTSGTLQSQITQNASDIADNTTLISTVSGSLQGDIIWEIVSDPSDVIRPKSAHINTPVYVGDNLTIGGNLTVSGTTTTVHSTELTVTDKIITVNAGEVGDGITGSSQAGIEVDRGTGTTYKFVFDEDYQNFRVGASGTMSLQPVATRPDTGDAALVDGYITVWNDSTIRFESTIDPDSLATVAELTSASGSLAGDISDHANSDGSSHTFIDQDVTSTASPTFSGITVVNTINEFSTDVNMTDDSDTAVPTEHAVKTYVDAATATLSGALDHGGLGGLSDDDHPQYILVSGARAFTGTVSGVSPTADAHLTTKQYVDDHTWTEDDIIGLDKYTQAEVDSMISSTSGTLQGQIDSLDDTYATDLELSTVSGVLNTTITDHTTDATIHFTQSEIDHTNLLNIGTTTHSGIDAHIADLDKHREINDSGTGATDLWSAEKILDALDNQDFDEIYGGDFQ